MPYHADEIKSVEIQSGITSIGTRNFYEFKNMTEVKIANTVKIIETNAFIDCDALVTFEIPAGLETIQRWPFVRCDKLSAINVNSQNQYFSSDNGVLFDKNKTKLIEYPDMKEGKSYIVPQSVQTIGEFAFMDTRLETITLQNGVRDIEQSAFASSKALKTIELPVGLRSIGISAFKSCTELTNVNLPEGLETMENTVFDGCSKLKTVNISSTVNQIDFGCFDECNNLESINVNTNNTTYTSINGILYDENVTKLIKYPYGKKDTIYDMPDTVTQIDDVIENSYLQSIMLSPILNDSRYYREMLEIVKCCNKRK